MQQPITRQQIEELQENNSVKLIDIRTPEEYEKMLDISARAGQSFD